MQAKLYVGNLSYSASEEDLKSLFKNYGNVLEVNIVRDLYSGQSKGFAFVQLETSTEAEKALELDGQEFMGRRLAVSEARPPKRENRPRQRGHFGRGHGGGDRGGRGRGNY
jgi:RNA recognition motif-containing protein